MDFFDKAGVMAIGSRLRMLSEQLTEEATKIYDLYNVGLKPKWFPVFYLLSHDESKSITQIAIEIGHSHPSVSKIVKEMIKEGILSEHKDKIDGRKNNIRLTSKGKEIASQIEDQYLDVQKAVEEILNQSTHNMWNALQEFEFLLEQKPLLKRVKALKKNREAQHVQIIPYAPKYKTHFKELNEAWITQHFKMEDTDRKSLDHPEDYILDKGGEILVALYNETPVGVCALIKMDHPEYDFELAKMAVAPEAKGKGIGWILGQATLDKAKSLGAKTVYLESNTVLKPAIHLYHKLGFKKVVGYPTPYERCNIQMAITL